MLVRDFSRVASQTAMLSLALLLSCQIGCEESDKKNNPAGLAQQAFERKKLCAEMGRARLAEDQKKTLLYFSASVTGEWCYSTTLNTCIYSVTTMKYHRNDWHVDMYLETVDLLTNQTILVANSVVTKPADWNAYFMSKKELFSKCQR